MSHYYTVVLIPGDTKVQKIHETVEKLLAPFDENIEADEYERECYCVSWKAKRAGTDAAQSFKSMDDLRDEFNEKYRGLRNEQNDYIFGRITLSAKEADELEQELDRLWEDHVAEYKRIEKEATESHPLFDKPDPECEDCNGTGMEKSTYNPESKWDWWVVGGRWNGAITSDPKNSEDGFNFGHEYHNLESNTIKVAELPKPIPRDIIPFAIITPDGSWNEKGKMGWWGVVTDKQDDWVEVARQILEEHRNCIAVGCDLHI